jgi:glycosyltransferase involved in cell wall biosynthesis
MIHLFINALAASAGGGLTYVRNLVPEIGMRTDLRATVLVSSPLAAELPDVPNVKVLAENLPETGKRFWYEQSHVPGMVRKAAADTLISAGNFALWRSPVPQILLSRNALYTSADFLRDVRLRGDYRLWLDTLLKRRLARVSIQRADCTIAPSEAFAAELRARTGRKVVAIHHGFDQEAFFAGTAALPDEADKKLRETSGCLRLLFVSHYNYYRNFETLFRALPLLKARLAPRRVKLLLTCKLRSADNPGAYRADRAAGLAQHREVADMIVELGAVPYSALHHLYRQCDVYVSPAYAESFAHPLVEAMASGLPVVASDLPVHREICAEAASYFPRFAPEQLAERVAEVAAEPRLQDEMREKGLRRSQDFSWSRHVDALAAQAKQLLERGLDTPVRPAR